MARPRELDLDREAPAPVGRAAQERTLAEQLAVYSAGVVYPAIFFVRQAVTRVTKTLSLPRNALVEKYVVKLEAAPAPTAAVVEVAQLRADPVSASTLRVVVDFGHMRTVSRVSTSSPLQVQYIEAWQGTKFGSGPYYGPATDDALLTGEVRTEKLQLTLGKTGGQFPDGAALAAAIFLDFTDGPADVAVTVNGVVAFSSPGPVQPTHGVTTANLTNWSDKFERKVDLTAALAALAGDATADETPQNVEIALTSLNAAYLGVTLASGEDQKIKRIRRMRFGGQTETTLSFAEEGEQTMALSFPNANARTIERVSLVATSAKPPTERVVPAVGPNAADVAEMVLDAAHAACMRLPAASGLNALTGVRVALGVGAAGAEVRVALWSTRTVGGVDQPLAVLDDGLSQPVTLEATAGGAPVWTTFTFDKPVKFANDAARPWVAILVSRGEAVLRFASAAGSPAATLRRGPPNGPWLAMPGPFQAVGGAFSQLGPMLRARGTFDAAHPVALLRLTVDGAAPALALSPTAKGLAGALTPGLATAGAATLRVRSHFAAVINLSNVDVTTVE